MGRHLLDFGTAIPAAIIVMILHELSKTFVYYLRYPKEIKESMKYALCFYRYIDPIGLICSVAAHGGFSKPYLYRMKDKKTNRMLGITGFMSLVFIAGISILALKYFFEVSFTDGGLYYISTMSQGMVVLMYLCFNIAFISIGMFLVNLFPIASFDMGNIVAGVSIAKFFEFLSKDGLLKMAVVLCLILGIPRNIGQLIVCILL